MKAKLIKKDSPLQEQLRQARKTRKARAKKANAARSAFEVTTEWLKTRGEQSTSARDAFAALFSNTDPQSV
jgi:glutathione synthase/RimK-type ligase-like ATP-grasp enzyme